MTVPALGTTHCGPYELLWGQRTYVMGIINVTPDSFSGDGLAGDVRAALAQARRFFEEGADLLDVGGESTRPGSVPISLEEELRRVIPVIERLAAEVPLPISVDTSKPELARRALLAGAHMINDVWGIRPETAMAELAAELGVPLLVMHNKQEARYDDVIAEVLASLRQSLERAVEVGVPWGQLIVDPGFGFGKRPEHNLEILRHLGEFRALGRPLLIGTSRKSTIGLVLGLPVEERLEGTAATVALSIAQGADLVRVHDVQAMVRVVRMSDAVVRGWSPPAL